MKNILHKWLMTGLLVTFMLATAVIPALAQEDAAANASMGRAISMGFFFVGLFAVGAIGFALREQGEDKPNS